MEQRQIENMLERFKSANIVLVDADCIGGVEFPEIDDKTILLDIVDKQILDKLKSANIILVDSDRIGDIKPPEVEKAYFFYLFEGFRQRS